jgi:hypothetical protein
LTSINLWTTASVSFAVNTTRTWTDSLLVAPKFFQLTLSSEHHKEDVVGGGGDVVNVDKYGSGVAIHTTSIHALIHFDRNKNKNIMASEQTQSTTADNEADSLIDSVDGDNADADNAAADDAVVKDE